MEDCTDIRRNRAAYSVTFSSCLFSYYLALLVLLVFLCSVLFLVFLWRLLCSSFSRVPCSFSCFSWCPFLGYLVTGFCQDSLCFSFCTFQILPVYFTTSEIQNYIFQNVAKKNQNVSYITFRHVYLNLNM